MKTLLIILSFVSIISFGQTTVNDTISVSENDTLITKERYLGLNIGTFIKQIMEPNIMVKNYSILYKIKKSNKTTYQFKINTYLKETDDVYGFTDSLNNMVSRKYTNNYNNVDIRAGIGLYDKLGYGCIYVSSSLILGYAMLSEEYNDNIIYIEDSVITGYGAEGEVVSEADFLTFGLDFTFGYEVDLGKHLMLSLEYNPEFTFHTMISSKYHFASTNYYDDNFINSNFNIFNVNLLYHFN